MNAINPDALRKVAIAAQSSKWVKSALRVLLTESELPKLKSS